MSVGLILRRPALWAVFAFAALILLAAVAMAPTPATVGIVGVIVGAGISAGTSILLARENRHLQLATAALDKRLATHQEAYSIWRKIVRSVHDADAIGDVVRDGEEWWEKNCLYLDEASRKAFRACLIFAASHKDLLQGPRSEEMANIVKENWKTIQKPGETLVPG